MSSKVWKVVQGVGASAWDGIDSSWEHGYGESFNGKLRDELLNVEVFDTLWEAKVLAERWRREYNQRRPHSALAYRPSAPEAQVSNLESARS